MLIIYFSNVGPFNIYRNGGVSVCVCVCVCVKHVFWVRIQRLILLEIVLFFFFFSFYQGVQIYRKMLFALCYEL